MTSSIRPVKGPQVSIHSVYGVPPQGHKATPKKSSHSGSHDDDDQQKNPRDEEPANATLLSTPSYSAASSAAHQANLFYGLQMQRSFMQDVHEKEQQQHVSDQEKIHHVSDDAIQQRNQEARFRQDTAVVEQSHRDRQFGHEQRKNQRNSI